MIPRSRPDKSEEIDETLEPTRASNREAVLAKVRIMRLEICIHTADDRRFPHGAPLKPKRYCDECIVDALLASIATMLVADFTPTSEKINALPDAIRNYIHELEARADPAGDLAARVVAHETCEALLLRVAELERGEDASMARIRRQTEEECIRFAVEQYRLALGCFDVGLCTHLDPLDCERIILDELRRKRGLPRHEEPTDG